MPCTKTSMYLPRASCCGVTCMLHAHFRRDRLARYSRSRSRGMFGNAMPADLVYTMLHVPMSWVRSSSKGKAQHPDAPSAIVQSASREHTGEANGGRGEVDVKRFCNTQETEVESPTFLISHRRAASPGTPSSPMHSPTFIRQAMPVIMLTWSCHRNLKVSLT